MSVLKKKNAQKPARRPKYVEKYHARIEQFTNLGANSVAQMNRCPSTNDDISYDSMCIKNVQTM